MKHNDLFDFLDEIGSVLSVDRVNGFYEVSIERISWIKENPDEGVTRASNFYGYSKESIDDAVDKFKENISGTILVEDGGDYGDVEYKVPIFKG